jgi:cytoskeletal protein RodZ
VQPRPTDTPRAAAPASDDPPAISGPSFLGLNDPGPSKTTERKRASLSIDPHSAPDSNLNYLLDDEEQPRHWSLGKVFFILFALALVVGLGYLRWKNHGFAFLNPAAPKPSAVAQDAGTTDSKVPAPSPTQSAPAAQPPATQPASSTPQPAGDSAASGGSTPPATPPAATPSATPAPAEAAKPDDTATASAPDKAAAPAPDKAPEPAAKEPAADTPDTAPKVAEKPKAAPREPAPKPSPTRPAVDPVAEAQKYLYGRGVTQDCEHGMRILKPAANQGNPKAMIEMGALYSAGLCTPHDLPTAYRWFAIALRKDPENMAVQTDLQKLWSEMTQAERQLAIKLSQ